MVRSRSRVRLCPLKWWACTALKSREWRILFRVFCGESPVLTWVRDRAFFLRLRSFLVRLGDGKAQGGRDVLSVCGRICSPLAESSRKPPPSLCTLLCTAQLASPRFLRGVNPYNPQVCDEADGNFDLARNPVVWTTKVIWGRKMSLISPCSIFTQIYIEYTYTFLYYWSVTLIVKKVEKLFVTYDIAHRTPYFHEEWLSLSCTRGMV